MDRTVHDSGNLREPEGHRVMVEDGDGLPRAIAEPAAEPPQLLHLHAAIPQTLVGITARFSPFSVQ